MMKWIKKYWNYVSTIVKCNCWVILYGKPDKILYTTGGIGDDLLLTAIIQELDDAKIWVISSHKELFTNNKKVGLTISFFSRYCLGLTSREKASRNLVNIVPNENPVHPVSHEPIHLIDERLHQLNLTRKQALSPTPFLFLTESEKQAGKIFDRQIVIQCSGKGAKFHIKTKDWIESYYQEAVTALIEKYPDIKIIQLGTQKDTHLKGTVDLRGKTSLRKSAAILANSICFIGQVGFLMHLAKSVNCVSVIIFGGRELPQQSGYANNHNLFTQLPCSPCWGHFCDIDMKCMRAITPEAVVTEAAKIIA